MTEAPAGEAPPATAPPASGEADSSLAGAAAAAANARVIQMGDLVVVYEGFGKQKAVTMTERGQYQNKYGNFFHKDWVGKPFGAKVFGKGDAGFVWLLAPTPELWTKVLPHRTQILYLPDISLICHWLELRPGSVVVESGTGSGSLTHSLVRAVAPHGHVYTFEFNRARQGGSARGTRPLAHSSTRWNTHRRHLSFYVRRRAHDPVNTHPGANARTDRFASVNVVTRADSRGATTGVRTFRVGRRRRRKKSSITS